MKYERLGVECALQNVPKTAFLCFINLKFKVFFWGHGHQAPTGHVSLGSAGGLRLQTFPEI